MLLRRLALLFSAPPTSLSRKRCPRLKEIAMVRYIVSDESLGKGWGHIFEDRIGEESTRFVYDTESASIVHLDVKHRKSGCWVSASQDEIDDVEDSLKNANEDALQDPDGWGLIATDDAPEWAARSIPAVDPSRHGL
jgi:hypothetical protein